MHFSRGLDSAGDKLVVVDFSASRWASCKIIKPFFHVNDCQDVASEYEVKCMTTFQFFKKGQNVGEYGKTLRHH
ncbi:thioredoxin-like [Eulemur rufifrons]|uniref:thioredoxin-like n=1 Tax=Eulemur rufifrons TaxID=859984 RepID=UPI0037427FC3